LKNTRLLLLLLQLQLQLRLRLQLQLLLPPPPPPPLPLLPPPPLLLLLLLLPLSGPSRRHLMAHGSSLDSRSHQRRPCLDSPYILSHAGGKNITREPEFKYVSKHFGLH
jgi:hypothetical protein